MPKIDVAIVGEPTGMRPAIARKALMVLDGEVHGLPDTRLATKVSTQYTKAIDVIGILREMQFDKVSPTLGPVKISVTQIEGALNIMSYPTYAGL